MAIMVAEIIGAIHKILYRKETYLLEKGHVVIPMQNLMVNSS